jgi:hypothetical protein
VTEARDPVLGDEGRAAKHWFSDSRPPEPLELGVAADFLDPEVGRVRFARVDQHGRNAGGAEHRGGGRAGEPPPIIAMSV